MRIFLEKKLKNRRSIGDSAPEPSLDSGGWRLCPQTPVLFSTQRISTDLISHPLTLVSI